MLALLATGDGGLSGLLFLLMLCPLVLPVILASILLTICRVRGRDALQWFILWMGSTVGTIAGAWWVWNFETHLSDGLIGLLEMAFIGGIAGVLALPIAAWVGERERQL